MNRTTGNKKIKFVPQGSVAKLATLKIKGGPKDLALRHDYYLYEEPIKDNQDGEGE